MGNDTFPEIESKINNNIEHSDDDKINIEVYNDNNILNTSSHYSNREKKNMFKKHKEEKKEENNKHVNIITNFKPDNIKSEEEEKMISLVSIKKVNDNIESNNMNIDTLQNNNSNNISMPMTSSNEIHINIDRLNILTNDENFNQESKQSQLMEIKGVLPYNDKESENEDAPQTIISSLNGNIIIVEKEDESTKEKMPTTKKLSKSVSKNSISSNKNIQKNNNDNFQSKIVSNSKSIEYSMQEDTLLQFLNHHQIQLIESNFNLFDLPQKMNLSMNPLYEDVFY